MFLCLNKNNNEEIIILDWRENIESLRTSGRNKLLICPQCKEPVIVKAGELKQSHFAHKSRGLCPLSNQSESLLKARSILYRWLKSKWETKEGRKTGTITVEKSFHPDLPRPVDCYVETSQGKKHAYWIVEKQLHFRDNIKSLLPVKVRMNWVFLKEMMKAVTDKPQQFNLTTTERDLASRTEYDRIYGHEFKSLHYLDEKNETLTTLRGLRCKHPPQIYRSSEILTNKISDVLIAPNTGEFVHPGEPEKLQEYEKEEKSKQAQREEQAIKAKEALQQYKLSQIHRPVLQPALNPEPKSKRKQQPAKEDNCNDILTKLNQPHRCLICGKMTTDWIMAKMDGTCECRDCRITKRL